MPEPEPSTAVAVRDEQDARPLPQMTDAEFSGLYRAARGFAESGLFKDARQAGQAFAKIMAGRDLGLTPFEAMSALHVVEGKVEAGADLHASRVRSRDGYDFRVAWLKVAKAGDPPEVEAVWADEEAIDDLRDTYGCAIEFTVDGKRRGVSRFTHADAVKAKLAGKDNYTKYGRNMYFNRAMTNGVAWFIPEVMGGLRVYGLNEIPREPDLTDVESAGTAQAVELPMAVEAIVARATSLGYAPLANRSAVAMAVDGQPEEFVRSWVASATRDLNRYAAGKTEPEPEPVDAEVVPDLDTPEGRAADAIAESFAEPDARPIDSAIARVDEAERIEALRKRANELLDEATVLDEAGDERAAEVRQEAEALMDQVDAAGPQEPEQGSLGL